MKRPSFHIPKQRDGDEPAWWFKDVLLVVILSLLFFGLQWWADDRRQEGADQLENNRQAAIDRSDDRRQLEDIHLENLRFIRERASEDPNESRPFAHLDLEGINLTGLQLTNGVFRESNLNGANLAAANLAGAKMQRTDLSRANLEFATLTGAQFNGANLLAADLAWADLGCELVDKKRAYDRAVCRADQPETSQTVMNSVKLVGAVLHDADLAGVDFWSSQLLGADLRGADMTEAEMTSVRAHGARFDCIDEPVADDPFAETNPRCTNLTGAVLHRADLTSANLSGAILDHVSMDGLTDLSGAIIDHKTRLIDICYQSTTKWPSNFSPPPARTSDCRTDESLEATVDQLRVSIQLRKGVDFANVLSPRCSMTDRSALLSRWGDAAQRGQAARYTIEPSRDEGDTNVMFVTVSSRTTAGTVPTRMGRWAYSEDSDRWQYDGC